MLTKKAGTILLNLKTNQVGLVLHENEYSFPKGHLEPGETLLECAIRETEEETMRSNHLLINESVYILNYTTPDGEDIESHLYVSIDDGPTNKQIAKKDREILKWVDFENVENILTYDNLKKLWNQVKSPIYHILENHGNITPAILTYLSICPTCYNKQNNYCVYGDISNKLLFENNEFECFLVGNPRADGHVAIQSKSHYKDMMEIPDDLCKSIFVFAKKMMNILKKVYHSESVYLCTMCDGPMNHFHIQLIPRYNFERRGSSNFVKPRKEYIHNTEKISKIKKMLQ